MSERMMKCCKLKSNSRLSSQNPKQLSFFLSNLLRFIKRFANLALVVIVMSQTMLEKLGNMFYITNLNIQYKNPFEVPDFVTDAIPFFIIMAILEGILGKWRQRSLYSTKDTIMSFSLGMTQTIVGVWIPFLSCEPYMAVFKYTKPLREAYLPPAFNAMMEDPDMYVVRFIIGLLGCDLGYYLLHKYLHEFHLLWAGHSLHHSGERYNLATALRQGVFQPFFSWIFYLPLAAIGFPVTQFLVHNKLNTLYQFWVHTEMIGRLPWWFELIMNTPSHHRMHHRPPGNCNYAGVLIIWDRLFGTFQSECHIVKEEEGDKDKEGEDYHRGVIYGLAKPLNSFDPVYANLHHLFYLFQASSSSSQASIFTFISKLFRKRVSQPFCFYLFTPEKFMPDVLYDLEYLNHFPVLQRPFIVFQRIFRLPNTKAELLTTRDNTFLEGRNARESPPLTVFEGVILMIHFFCTMGLYVYIVSNSSALKSWSRLMTAGLCCVVVLSAQMIRLHYK